MPDPVKPKKSLLDQMNADFPQEAAVPVEVAAGAEGAPLGFGGHVRDLVDSTNSAIGGALHETASFGIKAIGTLVQGGERMTKPLLEAATGISYGTPLADDALLTVQEWDQGVAEADGSVYKPKTIGGGVTQGITQFLTGYVTMGNAMRAAKLLQGPNTVARSMMIGAQADAVAFDPYADRLSNLLEDFTDQHPTLRNEVTGFLASDPNDTEAVGRLKNAFEGLIAGAVLEKTLRAFGSAKRYLYDSRTDRALAEKKFVKEMEEADAAPVVADAKPVEAPKVDEAPKVTDEALVAPKVDEAPGAVPEVKPTDLEKEIVGLVPDDSINFKTGAKPPQAAVLTPTDAEVLTKAIQDNPDWLEQGIVNIKTSGFNIAKSDSPDGAKLLLVDLMKHVTPTKKTFTEMDEDAVKYLNFNRGDLAGDILSGNVKAKDLTSAIRVGKSVMLGLVRSSRELGRKSMGVLEGSPEHTAFKQEMLANLQRSTNFAAAVKELQGHAGRGVVQGRMKWATDLSPDEMRAVGLVDSDEAAMALLKERPLWMRAMNAHNQIWINSLLSSPITHLRNVISNTLNTISLPVERMIGGALSGNGTMVREGADLALGLAWSFKDAFKMAAKSMGIPQVYAAKGNRWAAYKTSGQAILDRGNTKLSSAESASPSFSTDNFKSLKGTRFEHVFDGFGQMANIPSRFLTAGDEFFKQINYRAHVMALASGSGRKLGLKGKDLSDYIARRLDESMDDQGAAKVFSTDGINSLKDKDYDASLEYARRATFTSKAEAKPGDGMVDDMGNGLTKWLENGTHDHPYLKMIFPFVRTPVNILKAAGIRTPGLNLASKRYRDALSGKLGERASADARGQMAVGAALWTYAVTLASEGGVTGKGPSDPRERAALIDSGWQPYSFKNGDKFVSYQGMEPYASFFGMAADYADIQGHLDDKTRDGLVASLFIVAARNFTSKSYLTGVSQFAEAFTDPENKMESFGRQRLASYVPSGLNPIGASVGISDPLQRETRTALDAMMNKLPGFSQSLPPKRNVFGEAVTARQALGPDVISPFFTTTLSTEKAKRELARLGHAYGPPARTINGIDLTQAFNAKGQDFYDRWQEKLITYRSGRYTLKERLDNLVTSSQYAKWRENEADALATGDEPRTLLEVRAVIAEYRERAKQELIRSDEFPGMAEALRAQQKTKVRAQAGADIPDALKDLVNSFTK